MASEKQRDINPIVATTKRIATGKKKPAKKTGAMGTPKRKPAKKKVAKKTKK